MTPFFEFNTYPARLSDAERDRALKVLRDGVEMGRLSHDTFIRRMELALTARRSEDLALLTADLPTESRMSRLVFGTVEAVSGFTVRLRRAWQAERLPKLLLPHAGNGHPLRIGRDPANGLRLTHETVSRVHAELEAGRAACGCCGTSARPTGRRSTDDVSSVPPSSVRVIRSASGGCRSGSPRTESGPGRDRARVAEMPLPLAVLTYPSSRD